MSEVSTKRADVLAGSRSRSGSNLMAHSDPENFNSVKAAYDYDQREDLSGRPFGTNVNRIKTLFQPVPRVKLEANKTATKAYVAPQESERSPQIKKKKTDESPPVAPTKETQPVKNHDLPLKHDLPTAIVPPNTSHIERFKHTRAVFKQLEQDTLQAQRRDHQLRGRHVSPASSSRSATSPLLSPNSSSPASPEPQSRFVTQEPQAKAHFEDTANKPRSYSTSSDSDKYDNSPEIHHTRQEKPERRSRLDNYNDTNVNRNAAIDLGNRYATAMAQEVNHTTTPSGLLWKRKQVEPDPFFGMDQGKVGDRSGKVYNAQAHIHSTSSGNTKQDDVMDVDSETFSTKSSVSKVNGNHGDIKEKATSESYTSAARRKPPRNRTSSKDSEDIDTSDVIMRIKNKDEAKEKSLSKNEIEAALSKADNYLSQFKDSSYDKRKSDGMIGLGMQSKSTSDLDSKSKRRSTADASNKTEAPTNSGELRNWAKFRNQRQAQSSDNISKVSDKKSFEDISGTGIVSYRHSRTENKTSPVTQEAPSIPSSTSEEQSSSLEVPVTEEIIQPKVKAVDSRVMVTPIAPPRRQAPPLPAKPPHLNGDAMEQDILPSVHPEDPPSPAPSPGIKERKIMEHLEEDDTMKPRIMVTETFTKQNIPSSETIVKETHTKQIVSSSETTVKEAHTKLNAPSSEKGRDLPGNARFSPEEPAATEEMTLEEQVRFLSPASRNSILTDEEALEVNDFLKHREDGDGHEEPEPIADKPESSSEQDEKSESSCDEDDDFVEIPGLSSSSASEADDDTVDFKRKKRKIKFSKSPIKLYKTYSTDEYDRRNEDIDPVSASAEYELEKRVEKMDVFDVELVKGHGGLGLSIIGMGVGADAGLEKLGIFIKTLTPGGAALLDARIQVNDQIIEVDDKSLVGVTQAYAATVLRNTQGTVKFKVGRETDPSKSEVARLIQQSIEQDRLRDDARKQEQRRLEKMHHEFKPKDEVMEHAYLDHRDDETEEKKSPSEDRLSDDESAAGDATPLSMPSGVDSEDASSPDDARPPVEVFDLSESSSDSISPDMESQALFIKLKEAQYKNAVAEAELAKLKAKMILLENVENQKKHYEKKNEEMAQRLIDTEKQLEKSQSKINHYQDLLEGSQGQYITLEKNLKTDFGALEKKYHKAKKLIKEYQQREKDFLQEREALLQQQEERDHQYNALVKSLKDRIFQLESDLVEAQKAAGLPIVLPVTTAVQKLEVPVMRASPPATVATTPIDQTVMTSSQERYSESSSESGSSEGLLSPDVEDGKVTISSTQNGGHDLDSVEVTPLLDTKAHKARAHLASSGSNASRRPPTKRTKSVDSDTEQVDADSQRESESGLETWIKHDSDSTVKKSELKKMRAQQSQGSPTLSAYPPSSKSASSVADTDSASEPSERSERRDSQSDSVSTMSQSSYDPTRPSFRDMNSEIPMDTTDSSEGGVVLLSSKGHGMKKYKKQKSDGGVVLVSSRSLDSDSSSGGGIKLISSKSLNTGYNSTNKTEKSLEETDSFMVTELEDDSKSNMYTYNISAAPATEEGVPSRRTNQFQSGPIQEWNVENVLHWLMALELEQYTELFREKSITGSVLLQLDGSKLKTMGVANSKDRELLKKKIKDMKTAIEKERKQMEKERKAKEKEQKRQQKKK